MTYEEYLKQQNKASDAGNASLAATAQDNATAAQGAALKPESATVTQAQNSLQSQLQGSAQGFTSKYQPQLEALYDKVMNREKFSYDVASDPLYQQYKNQYAQMGQMAMQDTIGNASALTGGYGNSWAATAGNQAYQGYLQQLTNKVPELYEGAYNRYMQEGDELQNQLALTSQLYENDLQNYWKGQEFDFNKAQADREYDFNKTQADRDWEQAQHQMQLAQGEFDLNKTQAERDYELALQQMGLAQGEFDLNKTQAERDWELAQKQLEMDQGKYGITERSAAFDQAVAMMQMGMTPSTELLTLAGLTPEQAQAYLALLKGNGSGGSGGRTQSKNIENTAKSVADGVLAGADGVLAGAAGANTAKTSLLREAYPTMQVDVIKQGMQNAIEELANKKKQKTPSLPNYTDEENAELAAALGATGTGGVNYTNYRNEEWRKQNGK